MYFLLLPEEFLSSEDVFPSPLKISFLLKPGRREMTYVKIIKSFDAVTETERWVWENRAVGLGKQSGALEGRKHCFRGKKAVL